MLYCWASGVRLLKTNMLPSSPRVQRPVFLDLEVLKTKTVATYPAKSREILFCRLLWKGLIWIFYCYPSETSGSIASCKWQYSSVCSLQSNCNSVACCFFFVISHRVHDVRLTRCNVRSQTLRVRQQLHHHVHVNVTLVEYFGHFQQTVRNCAILLVCSTLTALINLIFLTIFMKNFTN